MNKYLIILLATALVGCNSTPKKVTHQDKLDNIVENLELAKLNKVGLCGDSKMTSFMSLRVYYAITCEDGRSFMLPKEK